MLLSLQMLKIPCIPTAIAFVLSVTESTSPENGKPLICFIQFPLPKQQYDRAKHNTRNRISSKETHLFLKTLKHASVQPHKQLRRQRKESSRGTRVRQTRWLASNAACHTATGEPPPPRAPFSFRKEGWLASKSLRLTNGLVFYLHKNTDLTKYLQLAAKNRKHTAIDRFLTSNDVRVKQYFHRKIY